MEHNSIIALPKIDLHCHLDGSLPVDYVRACLGQHLTTADLQVSDDCRDLAEYLEKFDLPLQCMQTAEGLKASAYHFLEGARKDNVAYIEVRFAPLLSVHEGLSCRQVIQAVLEGLEEGRKQFNIQYGVIVCAMRHHSEEDNIKMIKTAREFLGAGVCAADLAGNEAAYPMKLFKNVFTEVKRCEMPFTIHAGECGSVDNIKEAIELGAGRIGHGIAMKGHDDVQKLCVSHHVGVEMCPISNLQTKAVEKETDYPMKEFMKHEVLVTVNTDNRTVSNTNISKEMIWLTKNCNCNEEDLLKLMRNAAEASFASEEIKHQLMKLYD